MASSSTLVMGSSSICCSIVCSICCKPIKLNIDPLQKAIQPTSTLCGHIFHQECIKDWILIEQQMLGRPNLVEPELDNIVPCPACQSKICLRSTILLFPTIASSTDLVQPIKVCTHSTNHQKHLSKNKHKNFSKAEKPGTSLISELQHKIQTLEDANETLGTFAVHKHKELEACNTQLRELRKDVDGILQKLDLLLLDRSSGSNMNISRTTLTTDLSGIRNTQAFNSEVDPDSNSIHLSENTVWEDTRCESRTASIPDPEENNPDVFDEQLPQTSTVVKNRLPQKKSRPTSECLHRTSSLSLIGLGSIGSNSNRGKRNGSNRASMYSGTSTTSTNNSNPKLRHWNRNGSRHSVPGSSISLLNESTAQLYQSNGTKHSPSKSQQDSVRRGGGGFWNNVVKKVLLPGSRK